MTGMPTVSAHLRLARRCLAEARAVTATTPLARACRALDAIAAADERRAAALLKRAARARRRP